MPPAMPMPPSAPNGAARDCGPFDRLARQAMAPLGGRRVARHGSDVEPAAAHQVGADRQAVAVAGVVRPVATEAVLDEGIELASRAAAELAGHQDGGLRDRGAVPPVVARGLADGGGEAVASGQSPLVTRVAHVGVHLGGRAVQECVPCPAVVSLERSRTKLERADAAELVDGGPVALARAHLRQVAREVRLRSGRDQVLHRDGGGGRRRSQHQPGEHSQRGQGRTEAGRPHRCAPAVEPGCAKAVRGSTWSHARSADRSELSAKCEGAAQACSCCSRTWREPSAVASSTRTGHDEGEPQAAETRWRDDDLLVSPAQGARVDVRPLGVLGHLSGRPYAHRIGRG